MNRWKSPTCWTCRSTRSTGSSATTSGGSASLQAQAEGRTDINTKSGLEEIFEEISPIEDLSQTMSLRFRDHRFEDPKYSVEECKDRDVTYAAPLFVTAEFMNNDTGEIKSQTVFMGDFPLMTDEGHLRHQRHRACRRVSQLVRSPGVYFEQTPDKTSDKDIFTCKMIPSRGAWLEFEVDKRDMVGVRVDRKRKQNVTVLLKALGWTNEQILRGVRRLRVDAAHPGEGPHAPTPTRRCSTSTASCARASRRRARPRRRCWRTTTSTRSATTWPRSAATRSTRSSGSSSRSISRC